MLGGDALYVADIDQLVVLDAATGAVRRRVAAPGAQFLNDLTFAPDGAGADRGLGRRAHLRGALRYGGGLARARAARQRERAPGRSRGGWS